jgi:hypothetical protein
MATENITKEKGVTSMGQSMIMRLVEMTNPTGILRIACKLGRAKVEINCGNVPSKVTFLKGNREQIVALQEINDAVLEFEGSFK